MCVDKFQNLWKSLLAFLESFLSIIITGDIKTSFPESVKAAMVKIRYLFDYLLYFTVIFRVI
jgi:hypothetical protein